MEINIHEKEVCVKLVIYSDYTEMHGQQNIKMRTAVVELAVRRKIITNVAHEQGPARRISNTEANLPISLTCQLSL
jgi:hypothetical protein